MNPNFLERKYHLRTSDFDKKIRLLPSSILDLFQDVAGEHATLCNVGYYQLQPKNKCWVITKVHYEVIDNPKLFSDVIVKTWPIESKRIEFDRDYLISDTNGNPLIKGTSQWAILDIEDRANPKIIPARNFPPFVDEYLTERSFENGMERFNSRFETDKEGYPIRSGYCDIDMNGHVNNTKYANFLLNSLDFDIEREIKSFRLDYLKEIKQGSTFDVSYKENGKDVLCKGETLGNDGVKTLNFIAKITFKN